VEENCPALHTSFEPLLLGENALNAGGLGYDDIQGALLSDYRRGSVQRWSTNRLSSFKCSRRCATSRASATPGWFARHTRAAGIPPHPLGVI
jgi:hypothetical protein